MDYVLKTVFSAIKNNRLLCVFLLIPFYFLRFMYYAIAERSALFYRYYPGYHGSTIPSIKQVEKNNNNIYGVLSIGNDGIQLNEGNQQLLLQVFADYYKDFSPSMNLTNGKLYHYNNTLYGFNDAFILYCMLRHFKPNQIIEVGSGYSSALMLDTAAELLLNTQFTFIDPYSKTIMDVINRNPVGEYKLLRKEVQRINLETYTILEANDILFIDTSHVVKIGSDLSTLFFSVLPSLKKGVIIHIHDIWYPWEYPKSMIKEGRAYNEIYFTRAFLQYNSSFEIIFFSSFLESRQKKFIIDNMPGYFKDSGKSLWLRKIA